MQNSSKILLKDYIGQSLIGKHVRFTCDCLFNMDVEGIISGYEINNNEIVFILNTIAGKILKIGENHPKLNIEIL